MKRMKNFLEKHLIISIIVSVFLAISIVNMAIKMMGYLLGWIGKGICLFIKFVIESLCTKEFLDLCIDFCDITQYRLLNALVFYISMYFFLFLAFAILRLFVVIIVKYFVSCGDKIAEVLLKKRLHRNLDYTFAKLWLIKYKAEGIYFISCLKEALDVWETYAKERNLSDWVRFFSIENLIVTAKKIFFFFFDTTILHLLVAMITLYAYFYDNIRNIYESIKSNIMQYDITISNVIDGFELFTILFLLLYVVFDIRHKANGYSELRAERFKKLVQMEEKLLIVMSEMYYMLQKNMDHIVKYKRFILQCGALELSGKECYFQKTKFEFSNLKKERLQKDDCICNHLTELDDMELSFKKLSELENEFKTSSLDGLNIYFVDREAMLTKLVRFWTPESGDTKYMKMKLFCRSSMEQWYINCFIKPTESISGEKNYYTESMTIEKVLEESALLDYELERAFLLEMYMKKYIRKMSRRLRKINKFSRFNLN